MCKAINAEWLRAPISHNIIRDGRGHGGRTRTRGSPARRIFHPCFHQRFNRRSSSAAATADAAIISPCSLFSPSFPFRPFWSFPPEDLRDLFVADWTLVYQHVWILTRLITDLLLIVSLRSHLHYLEVRSHTVRFSEVTLNEMAHANWACEVIGKGLENIWSEYEQPVTCPLGERKKIWVTTEPENLGTIH